MRKKYRYSGVQEINILPLIDVLFLLLAFFIVLTATMVMQRSLPVNLSKAETGAKTSSEDDSITVSLNSTGELFVNKESVQQDDLLSVLSEKKQESPDAKVFLSADKEATHQMFTSALDTVRKGGFNKVSINVSPE